MIRAWLIALIREAVRLELADVRRQELKAKQFKDGIYELDTAKHPIYPGSLGRSEPKPHPTPVAEPSFEQMQAQALQDMENYYAPSDKRSSR